MSLIPLHIPTEIRTPRLLIRAPQMGDGAFVNAAFRQSYERLRPWFPWAQEIPTLEQSEAYIASEIEKWKSRENLLMLMFDPSGKELMGSTGLHYIDWNVPKLEIGAWINTPFEGKGYAKEAVGALTEFAFKELKANRVQLRCQARNLRSKKLIESLNFDFEGVMKNDIRGTDGVLVDMLVYSKVKLE